MRGFVLLVSSLFLLTACVSGQPGASWNHDRNYTGDRLQEEVKLCHLYAYSNPHERELGRFADCMEGSRR